MIRVPNLNHGQILGSNLTRHQVLSSNLNHDQSPQSRSCLLSQRAQVHHLFRVANLIHDLSCNGCKIPHPFKLLEPQFIPRSTRFTLQVIGCKFTTRSNSNSPPVQICATAIYTGIDSIHTSSHHRNARTWRRWIRWLRWLGWVGWKRKR